MHILMLIVTSGIIAMLLQWFIVDGFTDWIASRIILRPWQHRTKVLTIRYLYTFMYSTCVVLWLISMSYIGLLDK